MKRKVIKQRDSYTITLPMKWVKEHGIEESREVDVQEEKEGIIIQAEGSAKKKETTLKINSDSEPFIRVNLNNLYRMGYDKIKIFFETKKQMQIAQDSAEKRLLGFEVTEIGNNYIIIENVAEPSSEKQDVLLRRMFLLVKQSLDQVHEDMIVNKFGNFDMIKQMTQKVDQYDNFCRRNVSKKRFTEERVNFYWTLYVRILLTQHSILYLYEKLSTGKTQKIPEAHIKIFAGLNNWFYATYNSFYKKDLEMISKAHKDLKQIMHKTHDEMEKTKGKEAVVLYYMSEIARLTYLMTSPMLGILLK